MAHWIVRVARDHALAGADGLDIATSAPTDEAWATVERVCGVSGESLAQIVAKAFRTQVADLQRAEPTALKLLPASVAKRFGAFPVRDLDRSLEIATADPANPNIEQEVAFASGRAAVLVIAHPAAVVAAIDNAYTPEAATAALLARVEDDMAEAVEVGLTTEEAPESVTEEEVASGPVVRLTNLILAEAVTRGASDIHIQPTGRGGVVRYRTDGVLATHLQIPLPVLLRVVSRIKIMGDLDIADRLRPQDGRARILVAKRPYDLRISTVPTRNAEKAVIRILDTQASTTLADTGIQSADLGRIRAALAHRDGIFVVSGPTGSGKTTTLYGALRDIATDDINIMTVEDPVEYELPGLTQIQVDPKQGITFASALRAILRQDPDAIFVGEIRDPETAEVAVQASLTGHLVLATLHANDAVGSLRRFLDLGLDAPTLAEVLRGSLAQRLVRRVCPHCVAPADDSVSADERALTEQLGVAPRVRAVGCERCAGTGYMGRMPVTEFLQPSAKLAALVAGGAPGAEIHAQAMHDGMCSLLDSGRARVEAGETTLQELHRVLGTSREPQPNAGSAAATTAPRRSVAVDDGAIVSVDGAPDPRDAHVLLVDDDGTLRSIARSLLEKEGYCVHEANDGSEALTRLHRGEKFALMVLDLDMPLLGGREVLKAVRSSLSTASLPVLVLTGTNDHDAEVQLLEQGADDYMRKPLEPKRFLLRVKAALRRAGV
ncbi:MAG: ATPase, T2SS/T4P/T4SS family [Gemmatimonadales bacterium]